MPYYVYAIELAKAVLFEKRFRKRNPNLNTQLPCYYIGQTSKSPNIRFDQHKKGYKSNSFVRKYGMQLEPELYDRLNPIQSRNQAEKIEKLLAHKLQSKGYGVWWN